ncbi:hypothetical protein D1872_210990 [compost metagenome]
MLIGILLHSIQSVIFTTNRLSILIGHSRDIAIGIIAVGYAAIWIRELRQLTRSIVGIVYVLATFIGLLSEQPDRIVLVRVHTACCIRLASDTSYRIIGVASRILIRVLHLCQSIQRIEALTSHALHWVLH